MCTSYLPTIIIIIVINAHRQQSIFSHFFGRIYLQILISQWKFGEWYVSRCEALYAHHTHVNRYAIYWAYICTGLYRCRTCTCVGSIELSSRRRTFQSPNFHWVMFSSHIKLKNPFRKNHIVNFSGFLSPCSLSFSHENRCVFWFES